LSHDKLDGEFNNPWTLTTSAGTSSVFPSGDGVAGGEFRFRFTVLAADSDHDNVSGSTNYVNWKSYEPGMIYVSTTADDFDGNLNFGGTSLREAVNYANTASEPTTIVLPTGQYWLTRTGTEDSGTAYNDLDVLAAMTIQGDGAGLSVIAPDWGLSAASGDNRSFEVKGSAANLKVQAVTLSNGFTYDTYVGAAILAENQATVEIVDSALVGNIGYGTGGAVHSMGSYVTILRSVFTNDQAVDGTAVYASPQGSTNGSLTIGDSLFALNTDYAGYYGTPNVKVDSGVAKTDLGGNLYDRATGGFFNVLSAAGDHLGTCQYVVTTVADEFNHANDAESLSVREAVDLANQASGTQEIWVPAWMCGLSRDRGTNATDTDVSYGDLDVKDSLVVRGVAGKTQIGWPAGVVDEVFKLAGDYNGNGTVDAADYTVWQDHLNQSVTSGTSGDGNDNGTVEQADYDLWAAYYGHTLALFDIGV
jgi:CSLREA domain-containing protein